VQTHTYIACISFSRFQGNRASVKKKGKFWRISVNDIEVENYSEKDEKVGV